MIKSENIDQLALALLSAQKEIKAAKKDNQAYGYSYSDLGTVMEAVKEPLNKNGISFVQLIEESDKDNVKVTTLLIHSSGQYLGSTGSTGIPEMNKINLTQRAGAAQSYLKRYQLQALTGLPTEDNDANSDGKPAEPKKSASSGEGKAPQETPKNTGTPKKSAFAPKNKLAESPANSTPTSNWD